MCPFWSALDTSRRITLRLVTPTRALGGQRRLGCDGASAAAARVVLRRQRGDGVRARAGVALQGCAGCGGGSWPSAAAAARCPRRGASARSDGTDAASTRSTRPAAPRPGGTTAARGRSAGRGHQRPVHEPGSGAGSTGTPARRPAIRRGSSRALPEPKNSQSTSPPLERVRAHLPGMSRSSMSRRRTSSARAAVSVEHAPEGAFAQVDVAALPEPLEARERDAAGVVVLLGAARQLDVAGDLEDPGARAVARERSDGRDVAVPTSPATRDASAARRRRPGRRRSPARRRARPRRR